MRIFAVSVWCGELECWQMWHTDLPYELAVRVQMDLEYLCGHAACVHCKYASPNLYD